MSNLSLPAPIGDWLLELGVVSDSELVSPPIDSYVLNKHASNEFENGVRVARLLQNLGASDGELDTLKENNAPVAKLYNWNLLLPKLRARGLDVDQDMKVLIVAGDTDIVVDLLDQLRKAPYASPVAVGSGSAAIAADGSEAAGSIPPPQSAAQATSAVQFLAFCCRQEFGSSWGQALHLARSPKQLARQQMHGVHGARGGFVPIVRWYKLIFAHCKHLAALCAGADAAECEVALMAVGGGLSSADTDVALWCSRLLCRLAHELAQRGASEALWSWFSKQGGGGGAPAMIDAWRTHPELHAAGALMPLVLHYCGSHLLSLCADVLPRHLTSPGAYLSFSLELVPLLAASKGTRELTLQSGALRHLLTSALHVTRRPASPPPVKGLALELMAELWSRFTHELQSLSLDSDLSAGGGGGGGGGAPNELAAFSEVLSLGEGGGGGIGGGGGGGKGGELDPSAAAPKDAGSVVLRELKKGCRDGDLELQLTAHMALFRLLDEFASASHPGAPYLFNVLAFSLIENHHEPALRQFLARNMELCLQQQPFIPVGMLLKPLVKSATLYGYNNCDFDFFLTLAKHQRLGLRHALLMMQFLGKVCLNDALHGRVASIPFLVLVERFHDSEVLHDFLEIFCEQALATLIPDTAAGGAGGNRRSRPPPSAPPSASSWSPSCSTCRTPAPPQLASPRPSPPRASAVHRHPRRGPPRPHRAPTLCRAGQAREPARLAQPAAAQARRLRPGRSGAGRSSGQGRRGQGRRGRLQGATSGGARAGAQGGRRAARESRFGQGRPAARPSLQGRRRQEGAARGGRGRRGRRGRRRLRCASKAAPRATAARRGGGTEAEAEGGGAGGARR